MRSRSRADSDSTDRAPGRSRGDCSIAADRRGRLGAGRAALQWPLALGQHDLDGRDRGQRVFGPAPRVAERTGQAIAEVDRRAGHALGHLVIGELVTEAAHEDDVLLGEVVRHDVDDLDLEALDLRAGLDREPVALDAGSDRGQGEDVVACCGDVVCLGILGPCDGRQQQADARRHEAGAAQCAHVRHSTARRPFGSIHLNRARNDRSRNELRTTAGCLVGHDPRHDLAGLASDLLVAVRVERLHGACR